MSQKYDFCSHLVVNIVVNCSHGPCALPPPHNSNRGSDFLLVVHRNLPVDSGYLEIITDTFSDDVKTEKDREQGPLNLITSNPFNGQFAAGCYWFVLIISSRGKRQNHTTGTDFTVKRGKTWEFRPFYLENVLSHVAHLADTNLSAL